MTQPARQSSPGTRPPGAADEAAAARYVQRLFSEIAGRYDLLNHLLSFNMDRYWRRATARRFRDVLARPDARVLDLCCGTGDLSLAFARQGPARLVASDFAHPMLRRARQKIGEKPRRPVALLLAEADALRLPFPDQSFDLVACSFGFRNLANYRAGLEEIWRVLRPGGEAGILEFSEPDGRWIGPLYSFYFHRLLPVIGDWVSGRRGSYRYLPGSVDRFPAKREFTEWMRQTGFTEPWRSELTWGIAVLYGGRKPAR